MGKHLHKLYIIFSWLKLSRGARAATSSGDGEGSCRASCVRCGVLGRFFGFNHKIIINV
jgi:hypothetical protein